MGQGKKEAERESESDYLIAWNSENSTKLAVTHYDFLYLYLTIIISEFMVIVSELAAPSHPM
jgi:hypothetical protein